MSTQLHYRSYAKINLYLDVLRRRRDGFHNIETIFQTVSLCDQLTFAEERSHILLTCSDPDLDSGEGNLVYRAAELLRAETGCTLGARIHLEKAIPIAAGLAGGSGNAAATLVALNKLWDLRLSDARLRGLALRLGSDVPYCTHGGTVAATRRGEDLDPLPELPPTWLVLVHPPIAVSASRTYNHPQLERNPAPAFAGRTRGFRDALRAVSRGDVAQAVFNRMERPVFHDQPQLAETTQRLRDLGCPAAAMSGSGPTLFGLCTDQRQARAVAEAVTDYPTSVVATVRVGVERMR